ncbi:MAG: hypothetical protein Q4C88_05145 [Akkermansia sp.]|nr:hypothetical protein [Akkermansia sp.]
MKKYAILCAAGLMLLPAATATEEAMNGALAVWNQQYSEYRAALQFANTEEERAQVKEPDGAEIADDLWKSVSAKTREGGKDKGSAYEFDEPWAAPAVIWFVQHPAALAQALSKKKNPQRETAYYADRLMDALYRVHYTHPGVAAACAKLAEGNTAREYEILEKIYSRNQDKNARGCAALGMSLMLSNPLISSIGGSEPEVRAKRVYFLKRSLTLTEDNAMFGNARLSEVASEQAYRLRHLMPRSVPPQITVKDMGGTSVTVPTQGKPHLILFWAPEEETGSTMVRGIDKLAAANPGLEIVPVTHFATPDTVQQLQQQGISRTCLDDTAGSAARAYRIAALPTAVLVGADCTILYTGAPNMQLQAKIDACTKAQPKAEERPRVIVEDTPALQQAKPQQGPAPLAPMPQPRGDTPPALRDMPQFNAPL